MNAMHKYLLDSLQCPICSGNLEWKIQEEGGNEEIYSGKGKCSACGRKYPVRDGIGIFTGDSTSDSWVEAYRQLGNFMKTKDGKEFMRIPYMELNPADRLFQAFMLEIDGDAETSQRAEESAMSGLYSEDYRKCWASQSQYIAKVLSRKPDDQPVVDLASGRGILAETIAAMVKAPIVLSDISPAILERDRKMFGMKNENRNVDFLAFDVHHIPFRDSSIASLTTNLGFQNISEDSGQVSATLNEVKRVCSDVFLGISNFYDPNDKKNGKKISDLGLSWSFYKNEFLKEFRNSGMEVSVENVCSGVSDPTPPGNYFKEAEIDGLPVESAVTEWCTVVAKKHADALN